MRELSWAAQARREEEWERTSHMLAMLYNAFRDPSRRARTPGHFNPFVDRRALERPKRRITDPRQFAREEGLPVFVVQ